MKTNKPINVDWKSLPYKQYEDICESEKYELFNYATKSYFNDKKHINLLACIFDKMFIFFIRIPSVQQCDLLIDDYIKFIKNEFLKNLSKS